MKKLAIYGDSFAANYEWWPQFLNELPEFKEYEFIVLGINGAAPDCCYSNFLQTHHNYDKIIFLWSSDFRSTLITVENGIHSNHISFHYLPKLKDTYEQSLKVTGQYKNIFKKPSKDALQWVKNEWIFIEKYPDKNVLFNIAMRDSVKLLRPDAINVECFRFMGKFGLNSISFHDMSQFCDYFLDDNYDIRKNHLTRQQSLEFAHYMNKHIQEKDFDIHDTFVNPQNYYTLSKTVEEAGFVLP